MSESSPPIAEGTEDERLGFEKARYEYCAAMYDREVHRRERLDKKSDFYLALITLFLGVVFFNMDSLSQWADLISNPPTTSGLRTVISITAIVLASTLLGSLLAILQSVRVRGYTNPCPTEITYALFAPGSKYFEREDPASLLKSNAFSYAIALQDHRGINNRKADWIKVAAFNVFIAVLSLAVFLASVIYLMLL